MFKGHTSAVFCVQAGVCREGGLKVYSAGGSEGIFEWSFVGDWSGIDLEDDNNLVDFESSNLAVLPKGHELSHTFGDTVSETNF
jgi:hypothetical protein